MFRFDIKNTVAVGRVYVVDNVDLSPDFVVLTRVRFAVFYCAKLFAR